jgi:hypothetical protein
MTPVAPPRKGLGDVAEAKQLRLCGRMREFVAVVGLAAVNDVDVSAPGIQPATRRTFRQDFDSTIYATRPTRGRPPRARPHENSWRGSATRHPEQPSVTNTRRPRRASKPRWRHRCGMKAFHATGSALGAGTRRPATWAFAWWALAGSNRRPPACKAVRPDSTRHPSSPLFAAHGAGGDFW